MAAIEIRHSKVAGDTPAWPLIMAGAAELQSSGLLDGRGGFPVAWDHEVLYLVADAGLAGVIAYIPQKWCNQVFISLAYVDPPYRRCGYYRALWGELVRRAKADGFTRIAGQVDPRNDRMRRAAEAVGRRIISVTYAFDLGLG